MRETAFSFTFGYFTDLKRESRVAPKYCTTRGPESQEKNVRKITQKKLSRFVYFVNRQTGKTML
jgi:hypothetical protein